MSQPPLRRPHVRPKPAGIHWPVVAAAVVLCGAALTGLILAVTRNHPDPEPQARGTQQTSEVVPVRPPVKTPPADAPLVPEEKAAPARADDPPAAPPPPDLLDPQPEKPKPAVRQPELPRLPEFPAEKKPLELPAEKRPPQPPPEKKAPQPPPEKKPPQPPPEKKVPPRKPAVLTADELQKQLLKVPEVDFFGVAERLKDDIRQDVADKVRRAGLPDNDVRKRVIEETGRVRFINTVNMTLLEDARRQGLPVQTARSCRAPLPSAMAMQKISRELRRREIVDSPGRARSPDAIRKLREWFREQPPSRDPGTRRVLMQMLQVEDEDERQLLVRELGAGKDAESTAGLARLALFDPSPDIRRAATAELKKRPPDACRDQLLRGLRYVWAPVADNAARALVELKDRQAIPALLDLLGRPDPSLPQLDNQQKHAIPELVRLRHLRNCFLCHPAVPVLEAPVGGFVPPDGLKVPPAYYDTSGGTKRFPGDHVRADITFLRQDFSLILPTPDTRPGLPRQRFDFLVRTRPATPAEVARLKDPPSTYPQRDAVLFVLRELTGKDYGLSTRAWVDGLTEKPKAAPPDRPVADSKPTTQTSLLADLTAIDVGPRARPHRQALSPDGKLMATAVGEQVVITAARGGPPLAVLRGHGSPLTSVWWSLSNETIATDNAQGFVTVYDTRGRQIMVFSK